MVKNILSESQICEKFNVTREEIARASRQIDMTTGEIYYIVTSRSNGDAHEVRYNRECGVFTCTCKAGQVGVPCWARRAARAAAFEARQEERVAMAKAEEEARKAASKLAQAKAQAVTDARMKFLYQERDAAAAYHGFSILK